MIVGPQPASGKFLDFVEHVKEMVRKPVVADGPVVTLHVGVLLGLAWLDEIDADSTAGGPCQRHGADVLRAVVAADRVRFATQFDNPVQRPDDAFGWQREIYLDSQAFTIEVVDDVEQADAASVGKLVMHEVHRPALVDRSRHRQWLRLLAYQAVARLDPQIQLELPINPVDALVIPLEVLTLRRYRKHSPKPQLRWLFVSRTSQSAITSFSASSLAL